MLRRAQDPREAIEAGEDNGWTLATVPGALSRSPAVTAAEDRKLSQFPVEN